MQHSGVRGSWESFLSECFNYWLIFTVSTLHFTVIFIYRFSPRLLHLADTSSVFCNSWGRKYFQLEKSVYANWKALWSSAPFRYLQNGTSSCSSETGCIPHVMAAVSFDACTKIHPSAAHAQVFESCSEPVFIAIHVASLFQAAPCTRDVTGKTAATQLSLLNISWKRVCINLVLSGGTGQINGKKKYRLK